MKNKKLKQIYTIAVGLLASTTLVNAHYDVVYPIQSASKLECRFQEYSTLTPDCKMEFPKLHTSDYKKYSTENGGYNTFTRFYTVLWGASYKYGWDIGYGGHQGVDMVSAKGTPVHAVADGKVIISEKAVGWGEVISIEHDFGDKKIVTDYAHLSKRNVSKGDRVKAGEIIGEVGSTGNSTGNHLHFQVDLQGAPFYPYYYDYKECPYTYNQITEEGVCFDVLAQNTLDPIAFLETKGAIVDSIEMVSVSKLDRPNRNEIEKPLEKNIDIKNIDINEKEIVNDITIFNKYIHPESSKNEIMELQKFLKDLGYYNGDITGNYSDILQIVIRYQLTTGVIQDANDEGAGYFGPKTRKQAKKDYEAFLKSGKTPTLIDMPKILDDYKPSTNIQHNADDKIPVVQTSHIEKISKENLMTREEMEAKEREEFLKDFKFSIIEEINLSNITLGERSKFLLKVGSKFDKPFVGSTPGNLTFQFDDKKIGVFPNEFFYFDNGEREIFITGKAEGKTKLSILIGDEVVKSFDVIVRPKNQSSRQPESAKIYMTDNATIGQTNKGIIVLKDQFGKNIIGTKFPGSFKLDDNAQVEYCIKKGDVKNYKKIFASECSDKDFSSSLNFKYSDTIAGVLMFDYRIKSQKSDITFDLKTERKSFATKTVDSLAPKGLAPKYPYYDTVIATLESGITSSGMKQGYFGEDEILTKQLASSWLINAILSSDTLSQTEKNQKVNNLFAYKNDNTKITRKEFFEIASRVMPKKKTGNPKNYVDADESIKNLAVSIFGSEATWKDPYGEDYFRPDAPMTKGEGTYIITLAFREALPQLVRK